MLNVMKSFFYSFIKALYFLKFIKFGIMLKFSFFLATLDTFLMSFLDTHEDILLYADMAIISMYLIIKLAVSANYEKVEHIPPVKE